MHHFDDPEATSLQVIDATLAGDAVEPEYAELAELTLILAGQRPVPSAAFSAALDDRVARRFAERQPPREQRVRRRWLFAPGAAIAAVAAVVAVVVLAGGSGGSSSSSSTTASAGASVPNRSVHQLAAPAPKAAAHLTPSAKSNSAATSSGSIAGSPALTPQTSGRQIVQSAQLSLSTRPSNVDSVAQQVFDVIAAQNGVVKSSQVTASNNANGYAQFELSVPNSNLSRTMSALSQLHGASVVSRTDSTQDITQRLGGVGMRLTDARALRTALLRKLATATTTTEIESLKIQIRDVDASISSDRATLRSLHHQVDFSTISLTINASMVPGHPVSSGSSFTLGKALHDAGRVLVVAAGVALITLAVLVPVGMVVAVVLWVAMAIRRRRREQALDLV